MFRVFKIASSLTQTVYQNNALYTRNHAGWQRISTIQRFYSKKDDKECPPCNEPPVCKPPKPVDPECKPMDRPKHPCVKPPPDCNAGRRPIPPFTECPKSLMDDFPKPDCPYQQEDNKRKKSYTKILLIGTLLFLASCAAVYFVQTPRKKGKKPKVAVVAGDKKKKKSTVDKIPASSSDIPDSVPYLLIGGGTASFTAFRAIKSADPTAKVLVISNERDYPYMRPPLSKEIWFNDDREAIGKLLFKQWSGTERSIFYEPDDFYLGCTELLSSENGGVAVARGWTVTHLDVVERKAFLEDGYEIKYDKCLIATGALPKNLDVFANADQAVQDKVTLYRNIYDFQALYDITGNAKRIAIIGGGFLGSELACAIARKGQNSLRVLQIFKEGGNMGKILPEYLSFWTTEKVKAEGVEVIPHAEVTGVSLNGDQISLILSNNETVSADHIVVAVGAEPNTDIAEKSELEVDPELGGFLVNTELQARSHLYIAGDCACFYDTRLGRRRVEHHDHAVVSGRLAGENMTGAGKPYWHQSMFWSDLGPDVGYEAIGIVDAALPTVGVFAKATAADSPKAVVTATDEGIRSKTEEDVPPECDKFVKKDPEAKKLAEKLRKDASAPRPEEGEDFGKGVIFYLRDDIVVGIVLWNVFNRMNIARQVLKDERKYDDLNEVAKLFNIHDDE